MQDVKLTSCWGVELLEILNEMRKLDQMCDLHLVLKDGIVVSVHSCIIAAASPFLKSLLVNTQNPEINMEDFPADVIKQIIEFIYTGEVTVQGDDLVMLHSVAISLHIPVLASVAQKLIHDNNLTPTHHLVSSEQTENVPIHSGRQDNTDLMNTIPPKRRPGRPRKSVVSEKSLLEEKQLSEISDLNETAERTVLPSCLSSYSASPQVSSQAVTHTKLPVDQANSGTELIQPKHIPTEERKSLQISEGGDNMDQTISDISGSIVYITEPGSTPPGHSVSIKLEKEDDSSEMVVDSASQLEADASITSTCRQSVNKAGLGPVVAAVDANSSIPEGLNSDMPPLDRPRRKTAQGAALAAKVPVHVGPTYTCTICDRSFTNEDMYNRHYSRHRNNSSDIKRFSCQYCDFSTMYKAALDEHVHVHTGEKPYACTECDKAFKHKKSLQIHMWIHAGKKFPCPLCGKEMSTAQYRRRHMSNVHSDYRPYKCSTCSRCFNRLESLKKHMDTHNDVPKYDCVFCNRRFLTQIALKNHVTNKHKERRRYCCLKCGNDFINLHKIKTHRCLPPDDGKKRRRTRDTKEDTDVKPQLDTSQPGGAVSSDTSHQLKPQSTDETGLQNNQQAIPPDHVYTPKKEQTSQVMIVSNSTTEEEFEDTDGETSSEDDDEELLNMDLDEPEDG